MPLPVTPPMRSTEISVKAKRWSYLSSSVMGYLLIERRTVEHWPITYKQKKKKQKIAASCDHFLIKANSLSNLDTLFRSADSVTTYFSSLFPAQTNMTNCGTVSDVPSESALMHMLQPCIGGRLFRIGGGGCMGMAMANPPPP